MLSKKFIKILSLVYDLGELYTLSLCNPLTWYGNSKRRKVRPTRGFQWIAYKLLTITSVVITLMLTGRLVKSIWKNTHGMMLTIAGIAYFCVISMGSCGMILVIRNRLDFACWVNSVLVLDKKLKRNTNTF